MTICEKCQEKKCLVNKKPCEAVEKILRTDKIYSSNWIRPKMKNGLWREIPFSSLSKRQQYKLGLTDTLDE